MRPDRIDITLPALRQTPVSGRVQADTQDQAMPAPHPERAKDMWRASGQAIERILTLTEHCL